MRTATLDMPVRKAVEELARWRPGRNKEDILIARAFRTIAKGGKVIDLFESMKRAGCDAEGRPMLAIARADATQLTGRAWDNPTVVTFQNDVARYGQETRIPANFVPGLKAFHAIAKVPIIPPIYRRRNLRAYWILFEAAWNNVTKDPLLLQHLGGALYRVVATWDLTPIEQAVLRARR